MRRAVIRHEGAPGKVDQPMTQWILGAMIAFGLLLGTVQPAVLAGDALIETSAPLADRSEASIKAAVLAALDRAVRGAVAMGFAWFELLEAQVSDDEVAIQILASDEEPGDPDGPSDGTDDDLAEDVPEVVVPPAPRVRI